MYHRSCYSHYISERDVKAAQRKSSLTSKSEDLVLNELMQYITKTEISSKKMITLLSSLTDQYAGGYLKESERPESIYSRGLKKERLIFYFGDRIGKSDFVLVT
jgi:hypothetical protein